MPKFFLFPKRCPPKHQPLHCSLLTAHCSLLTAHLPIAPLNRHDKHPWTHPSPSPLGRPNSPNPSQRNCAAVCPPSRKSKPSSLATFHPNRQNREKLMTDALEIRRASPGHLLKSGCGVPPLSVAGGVSPAFFLFISAFQLLPQYSTSTKTLSSSSTAGKTGRTESDQNPVYSGNQTRKLGSAGKLSPRMRFAHLSHPNRHNLQNSPKSPTHPGALPRPDVHPLLH